MTYLINKTSFSHEFKRHFDMLMNILLKFKLIKN